MIIGFSEYPNPQDLPFEYFDERSKLPNVSCIYFCINSEGEILYIGKSKDVKKRWYSHHVAKKIDNIHQCKISWMQCDENLLDEVELALIEWFDPPLNTHPLNFERLTRAGMGQPRKGYKQISMTLPPELLAKIDEVATQQEWKRNYTVIQLLSARLGLQSDYDNADLDLILKGHIVA